MSSMHVFSGTANPKLAKEICEKINIRPSVLEVTRFADSEIKVTVGENVRAAECFVIQPTCNPGSDNLMELLITVDALKRSSAGSIVAVMPYFGYARQDRKDKPRTPITAKLVADLLTAAGVDRVVTVDLHSPAVQGFFDIPVDNLYARNVLMDEMNRVLEVEGVRTNCVIVSPDAGGVARARAIAEKISAPMAIIDKRRAKPNESEVMNLIGDVKGMYAVIVDDMIDTAGTLVHAVEALAKNGAIGVAAVATHGVLSGEAYVRIGKCTALKHVIVTDSIPQRAPDAGQVAGFKKVRYASIAGLVGEAIRRIYNGESISTLFA